jgi:hypothetical protein
MRRLSAVLLILFCLAGTSAAPPPDGLSKKFLGAWRLVSIEGNPPGRTKVYDRPTGLIMYDPSGHMCVNIVLKADRKPFAPFTDNVRWVEFQGADRLLLIPIEGGKGGVLARKDATYRLLWERLK